MCDFTCDTGTPDPECTRCICGAHVLFIYITSKQQGLFSRCLFECVSCIVVSVKCICTYDLQNHILAMKVVLDSFLPA